MKTLNKIVLFLLIGLLVYSNTYTSVHAVSDPTGPVFYSVWFDRADAYVGDVVTLTAQVDDPESGITYCYAELRNSDRYLNGINMNYNSTTGFCSGSFEVNQYWESPAWIGYFEVGNGEGNYSYFYEGSDFTSPTINFPNTTPDHTGPILNSVWFDTSYAYVNQMTTLYVDVFDPESGIDYCYANLYNSTGYYVDFVYMDYNLTTGYCTGTFSIYEYYPSAFYVYYIEAGNGAGNYSYFYDGTHFTSPTVTVDHTDIFAPDIYVDLYNDNTYSGDYYMYLDSNEGGWGNVYVGGTWIADLHYNTSTYFWFNTTWFDDGWYEVGINVWDVNGNNAAYTYWVYFNNDVNPPNIELLRCEEGNTNCWGVYDYDTVWGAFDLLVKGDEPGGGEIYIDGTFLSEFSLDYDVYIWLDTFAYENGLHEIYIWVSDHNGNEASYTFWIYFDNGNTPPNDGIEVYVNPSEGLSYVDEVVKFEVEVTSHFLHDMPEVRLALIGSGPSEDFEYEDFFYLRAQSTQYYTMEVTFLEAGHYNLAAILYDDIDTPWTYTFGWEVKEVEPISEPTITTEPDNSTTSDPSGNQTDPVDESSSTPEVSLPGFTTLITGMSFVIATAIVTRRRK
ncbi:MAG: hypothetical protein ACXAD7_24900 [Candidatus Kariarchaeaceae archaeon]|jgi:hypothetical protein